MLRSLLTLLLAPVLSLFIPIQMAFANRTVSSMEIETSDFERLSEDDLAGLIDSEWERATNLDEKIYKLTAALSVAVAVAGVAGSTMLQNLEDSLVKDAATVFYLVAVVLLAIGTALGFNGILPKKRYGYGAKYQVQVAEGGEAAKLEMIAAAREFQRDNLIRSNETTAAVVSIRNGILFFVIGILINLYGMSSDEIDPKDEPEIFLVGTAFD